MNISRVVGKAKADEKPSDDKSVAEPDDDGIIRTPNSARSRMIPFEGNILFLFLIGKKAYVSFLNPIGGEQGHNCQLTWD